MLKDQIKLHVIVFIWGFTAILGKLLEGLTANTIVFYRTLLCVLCLFIYFALKKSVTRTKGKQKRRMLYIGMIIGVHWMTFFLGIHVSNVSTTLIGIATGSLWTAILEPIMLKKKMRVYEIILGFLIIIGIAIIYQSKSVEIAGLLLGIIAAILASIFTILNVKLVGEKQDVLIITQYEMLGACLIMVFTAPLMGYYFDLPLNPVIRLEELGYLLILALVCTIIPYAQSVELLKRMSAYSVNLAINMEPVYAIILAVILYNEHKEMTIHFYIGALIVLISVFLDPMIKRVKTRGR